VTIAEQSEKSPGFAEWGIRAFTTTRGVGTFGTLSVEPVCEVMGRWAEVRKELGTHRFATATQVHGANVIVHQPGWTGWLRGESADGHASHPRGTGLAVTVADCVPVFIGHPSGAIALLHSGWRGTAARIVERGIAVLAEVGLKPSDMRVHTGPAICGKCYEVSPDVYAQLTGTTPDKATTVDLRALILDHARAAGVKQISTSQSCTRCDNNRFFSHRAGDPGRQIAVMIADPT